MQIARSTALTRLEDMVKEGLMTRTEVSWRSNALKFYYYPTDKVWTDYHAKLFRAGYLRYMRSMMEM
jgi:predicted transcriptional regulator